MINKVISVVKFTRRRWYIAVIVIIAAGIFMYQKQAAKVKAQSATKPYTVGRQTVADTISLSGEIDAQSKATVRFITAGKIVWVGAKEGDRVKQYQGLASMDTRDINKRIQKYLNTYTSTRSSFDQTKEDYDNQAAYGITPELRDEAKRLLNESQMTLNNSVLDLEIQDLAKEASFISSPIEGIVTRAPQISAGAYISLPTQAEYEVVDPATLYFSASADQNDVIRLQEGMRADIAFDPYPDNTIPGTITSISFTPQTDESGTSYKVKMAFNPGAIQFRLGMTGDAAFTFKEFKDAVTVPEAYVSKDNGSSYVIKQVGRSKVKTLVETGDTIEGDVIILNGLQEGDIIYD